MPKLCLTRAHSSASQRIPAHMVNDHFPFGRKQLRVLTPILA